MKRELPEWMYDESLPVEKAKHRYLRWLLLISEHKELTYDERELREMVADIGLIFTRLPPKILELVKLWVDKEMGRREATRTGAWNR